MAGLRLSIPPLNPYDPTYANNGGYVNYGGVGASSGTWNFSIPNLTNLTSSNGLTFDMISRATDTALIYGSELVH